MGIPELKIEEEKICGDCQVEKEVKTSYKMVQHLTTSRGLEFLHMDLMGPMKVKSLGGKKYVFVYVNDYFRNTWVDFIRENSDTFVVFEALCHSLQRENGETMLKVVRI